MSSSPETPPMSTPPSLEEPASSPVSDPTTPPPSSSPPSPSTAPGSLSRIGFADRIFLTGTTRSGKSTLARKLFLAAPAPRMVIDPADSSLTEVPGAVTFSDPSKATNAAGENWHQAATARFVPSDPDDLDAYSAVYNWCFNHFPRRVWCDEAGIALPVSGTPKGGRKYLVQGAKRGLGHQACHTRPKFVAKDLIAQAEHVFVFETPASEDRDYLAANMGVPRSTLEQLHAELVPKGFLWWDRGAKTITVCSPLKVS